MNTEQNTVITTTSDDEKRLQAIYMPVVSNPSRTGIIHRVTQYLLDNMTRDELFDAEFVQSVILRECNSELDLLNSVKSKDDKFRKMAQLVPAQVADILMRKYPIALVRTSDMSYQDDQCVLCVYQSEGPEAGLYVESDSLLDKLIRETVYDYPDRSFEAVKRNLRMVAPIVSLCRERDLIAVNNGIFNYKTKELLEFSPEYVFLSKSYVNYNPGAVNVVIHNDEDGTDWDVESWMTTLSDDMEVVGLLWQILGAVIRPNVRWNKSAWFYSERGNNGKGTLCELMKYLVGNRSYVSLPLCDMGIDFKLEPLLYASAIIVDENDVGTFIDKAANLKAIITGDTIPINRKFKRPITYAFYGFMVQCLNEMPKIRDKSDSFFRRQIFIPFDKCFTGQERKYIKEDYLHRPEVLEYVLYKVLHMNYYELDVPKSCVDALNEYKTYVDPIYAFLQEVLPELKWDLLPWNFLYDLYCAWYRENNQGNASGLVGSAMFIKDVKIKVQTQFSDTWQVVATTLRPGDKMSVPEPLIYEYRLEKWMNPMYQNDKDVLRQCVPVLASSYRGICRI